MVVDVRNATATVASERTKLMDRCSGADGKGARDFNTQVGDSGCMEHVGACGSVWSMVIHASVRVYASVHGSAFHHRCAHYAHGQVQQRQGAYIRLQNNRSLFLKHLTESPACK